MNEQDEQIEHPAEAGDGAGETNGAAPLTRSLARSPRALAPRTAPLAESRVVREQVAILVAALADPANPLYPEAVDALARIGDPAVPVLCEALNERRPWLMAYHATEALGRIGDGRATGALIEALRHPNSNVRWGAVRALAAIGDARAMLELRRVARDDRGKTSWGEPVAGAAQSALDGMRAQNVLFRGAELLKTALACVTMLVALILAWTIVASLRDELRQIGSTPVAPSQPIIRTVVPTPAPAQAPSAAGPAATAAPRPTAALPAGSVLTTGNVRAAPSRETGERIGLVSVGDDVVFLGVSPDGQWFRVRLGERRAPGSRIDSPDGTGWVIRSIVSPPPADLPVETPVPQPTPTP
jgi:hypothetical protein